MAFANKKSKGIFNSCFRSGFKLLGWGTTLTNNETNDIKVIKFFENRGILLLNFLAPLIRAGLPLMKNVLKHLAKSVLPAVVSATSTAVQKKLLDWGWNDLQKK